MMFYHCLNYPVVAACSAVCLVSLVHYLVSLGYIERNALSRHTLRLLQMSDKNQRLVLSIIDFLNTSISAGDVKADDKEGLEVAGERPPFHLSFKPPSRYHRQFNVSARPLASIHPTRSSEIGSASSLPHFLQYSMSSSRPATRSEAPLLSQRLHLLQQQQQQRLLPRGLPHQKTNPPPKH